MRKREGKNPEEGRKEGREGTEEGRKEGQGGLVLASYRHISYRVNDKGKPNHEEMT